MTDDFLAHVGVKGMKWGIRKDRSSSGKGGKGGQPKSSELSDQELRQRINRLNMEKQYSDLTKSTSRKILEFGLDLTKSIIVEQGKQVAGQVVRKKMLSYINPPVD